MKRTQTITAWALMGNEGILALCKTYREARKVLAVTLVSRGTCN